MEYDCYAFTAGFFIRYLSTDLAFFRHASFLTRKSSTSDYHQIQDEKKTVNNFGSFLTLFSSNSVEDSKRFSFLLN